MDAEKILFIAQDIEPYVDKNPMGHTARFLPQRIQENGADVRIFMPSYGTINTRRHQLHEVIRLSGINVVVNDEDYPLIIRVASVPQSRMQIYFIYNEEFFKRKSDFDLCPRKVKAMSKAIEGRAMVEGVGTITSDNDMAERSVFFVRGVYEAIRKLRWVPNVIHCMGWFGALTAAYLKKRYQDDPCFERAKVVFSPFMNEREGKMPENIAEVLAFDGMDGDWIAPLKGEATPQALRRMGIAHSDGVIFVEDEKDEELYAYAKELGKPILENAGSIDTAAPVYQEFYDKVLTSK